MLFPPWVLLLALVLATIVAGAVSAALRARRKKTLRALASRWNMQYAPRDPFRLAGRIARRLPQPGAADVRVRDVLYSSTAQGLCCLLTAEYTLGATAPQERLAVAAGLVDRAGEEYESMPLLVADSNLPLLEQYARVHEMLQEQCPNAPADFIDAGGSKA